jgi:transcriptional regulator with XRE-family HTH domain
MELPRLKELRELAALTQAELADLAGVGRSTLTHLESGQSGAHPATARKIAKALGCEPRELMRKVDG